MSDTTVTLHSCCVCSKLLAMPKKSYYILSRLNDFAKNAKHLIDNLSPRKKHKRQRVDLSLDKDVSFTESAACYFLIESFSHCSRSA
jgi:hypothetical protein